MSHVKDLTLFNVIAFLYSHLVGQIFIIFSIASLKSYKHGFVASVCQVLRKLVVAHSPHIRDAHDHTPGSHAHKYPGERGMMIMGEYSSVKSLSLLNLFFFISGRK